MGVPEHLLPRTQRGDQLRRPARRPERSSSPTTTARAITSAHPTAATRSRPRTTSESSTPTSSRLFASPWTFLSHDWPRGIAHHGDLPALLRKKKFLADENRTASARPAEELMRALRPRYWPSAHLHVKFAALVGTTPRATRPDSSR